MSKHSKHIDYICTKARDAMGWSAIGYFGRYSIRKPMNGGIEDLIRDWFIFGGFNCNDKPHTVTGRAEKCRQVAIRLIERNGKFKRTLQALKRNNACRAWQYFICEREGVNAIEQYKNTQAELGAKCILLFRMGDFYEVFFDNAEIAAKALGRKIDKRAGVKTCRLHYHFLDMEVAKLLRLGYQVAIKE